MNPPLPLPNIAWQSAGVESSELKVCVAPGQTPAEARIGNQIRTEGPLAYFLAALGSFTADALRTYAANRNWDLQKIELSYRRNKNDERSLQREIRFIGNLGAEHQQQLLRVAEECPIHRRLTSHLNVQTTLI